jgi:coproporphyrinogen III oxidase-like Fe-S oxidoreductase
VLVELECDALIAWDGDRVALTERGRLMSNEVFTQFLADPETGSSLRKTA